MLPRSHALPRKITQRVKLADAGAFYHAPPPLCLGFEYQPGDLSDLRPQCLWQGLECESDSPPC